MGKDKLSFRITSHLMNVDKLSMHDLKLYRRSPACLIPRTNWTRACSPFSQLCNRWMMTPLLDSSYRTDEDESSFRATLYRTNEVPLS